MNRPTCSIPRYRVCPFPCALASPFRRREQYSSEASLEDRGMEEYFLALEFGLKEDDTDEFVNQAHREMQMPILDAIYNDGGINRIDYGAGFERYLSSFDNVFTINYDSNLDRYRSDIVHLHEEFSRLVAEYDPNSDYSIHNPDKCKVSSVSFLLPPPAVPPRRGSILQREIRSTDAACTFRFERQHL